MVRALYPGLKFFYCYLRKLKTNEAAKRIKSLPIVHVHTTFQPDKCKGFARVGSESNSLV